MIIALQTLIFFRESLFRVVDRLLRPYYKHFSLAFNSASVEDDVESDEHVFAEFDDEKGVVFYPPVYAQRYAAVSDCLMDERWNGKLEKVVDLGYHDMSFIKYLKEVPGVIKILGVDIETVPLRCSSDLLTCEDYAPKRENPLQITLFHGNAADPDYRLVGCDAVVGIEMIEHMFPHDLDRLVHTVFGFIRPWVVIFTTPNADFNVLFKALEKNGLRRLDHFFEWTREQFNDWCSNIVARYPEYTVSCKGIGPGPPGTLHLGCCSQMAVFVSKSYHKQDDLNINSLALVADAPSPGNFSEYIGNWESPENLTDPMICQSNGFVESLTDFPISIKHSHTTILLSPSFSVPTLEYRDKTSQCNLEKESGKNFLMFDDEQLFNVLVPRTRVNNRVYLIEDVSSRLNCTTLQVKKFSKTTQNLMAKNKIDSLVHTREVVDEIRHLTKALNFNKECANQLEGGVHTWYNINWGDNAPYWNQYYKIVREYNYPFETKSEECRILDLIFDEINRMVDAQYEDDYSVDLNRLEIPLQHLMGVVAHVSDDVEKVKDLLEWNGYEVVDDVVIHSRLVVDSSATHDDDWQDNDTFSDWDTADAHSTVTSDGSTFVPDYHGRCVRRALDQKVRKLRTMLSVDEDITAELDRVVCRLMKLALRSSRGRLTPPPARWMQCKLLDLLTLTEKAIERRKRHFIETYPMKAIEYEDLKPADLLALEKIKDDVTGTNIVDKYRHLLKPSDKLGMIDDLLPQDPDCNDFDFISVNSKDSKDFEVPFDMSFPPAKVIIDPKVLNENETKLERVQAWVDDDFELVPYPEHDNISSGDNDRSAPDLKHNKNTKSKKRKVDSNAVESRFEIYKISRSKTIYEKRKIKREKNNKKASSTKISKKMSRKKSCYSVLVKSPGCKAIEMDYDKVVDTQKKVMDYTFIHTSLPKPIPESLIQLCTSKLNADKDTQEIEIGSKTDSTFINYTKVLDQHNCDIAATKESLFISIVMEEEEETIAMRRTVGTDAEEATTVSDSETVIRSFSNDNSSKHNVSTVNILSQTIFLNDINEPSTSKGIRHVSMDVQCGPDVAFLVPSAATSFAELPTGDQIIKSVTDINKKNMDIDIPSPKQVGTITPRMRSIGIKIRDSGLDIGVNEEIPTITQALKIIEAHITTDIKKCAPVETEMIKPIASNMDNSISDCYESADSLPKTPITFAPLLKKPCLDLIENKNTDLIEKYYSTKYVRPILCRGGVHVHSYRDKQISEDVVFQGEWQRNRRKALAPKKAYNPVITRKMIDTAAKRKRDSLKEITVKKLDMKEHNASTNQFKKNNTKLIKNYVCATSDEIDKKSALDNSVKVPFKNVVKVATKLTASLKSSKSELYRSGKKPVLLDKNDEKFQKACKSFVPSYLKRKKPNLYGLNKTLESVPTVIKVNTHASKTIPLVKIKREEIKKDLLQISHEPILNLSYIVFRNGIDDRKGNTGEKSSPSNRNDSNRRNHTVNQKGSKVKRIKSYQSPNSSTCSSPNSIATVRAAGARNKTNSGKRHSTASYKNNTFNSESDSSSPTKAKKPNKRCKSAKKPETKVAETNKENIPKSSKVANSKSDDTKVVSKTPFMSRHENIYIAQIKPETSHQPTKNNLSKHHTRIQNNTSNILIPTPVDANEKEKASNASSLGIQRKYLNSDNTSADDFSNLSQEITNHSQQELSNMVLVLEPNQTRANPSENGFINLLDKKIITEWIQNSSVDGSNNTEIAMRQLVEETLEFIDSPFDDIDSETVILSRNDENDILYTSASPQSFKTVVTNADDLDNTLKSDLELALNRTFDTSFGVASVASVDDSRITPNELDNLSLKSTSGSKYSEYFLADSEFEGTNLGQLDNTHSNSVRDIFERKELAIQNTAGSFDLQALSEFSLLSRPVAGDRLDTVALIDSETGSVALESGRRVTSEELFISGRSSDSYESCLVDEDAVVPNWLFNIISHQQSEVLEDEAQLPVQMPLAEPLYDTNGNMMEAAVGAGAGAGDGRGMHSDRSQDSSGRGTSLSSSEVSSEPQSEAILIDPSVLTNQYDLPLDSVNGLRTDSTDITYRNSDALENNATRPSSSLWSRPLRVPLNASDIDADISSIDTDDMPDSSTDLN